MCSELTADGSYSMVPAHNRMMLTRSISGVDDSAADDDHDSDTGGVHTIGGRGGRNGWAPIHDSNALFCTTRRNRRYRPHWPCTGSGSSFIGTGEICVLARARTYACFISYAKTFLPRT